MTAIRAIFDGKTFVPQQPVSIPAASEAIVLLEGVDRDALLQLETEMRAYYASGSDGEDDAWRRAIQRQSERAWDED